MKYTSTSGANGTRVSSPEQAINETVEAFSALLLGLFEVLQRKKVIERGELIDALRPHRPVGELASAIWDSFIWSAQSQQRITPRIER